MERLHFSIGFDAAQDGHHHLVIDPSGQVQIIRHALHIATTTTTTTTYRTIMLNTYNVQRFQLGFISFLLGIFVLDSQVVQKLVEASVEARCLDSVQAILTVLGCMANQGVQATHWGGCLG